MHFEQTLYYWNVPGHEDHTGFFENFRSKGFFNNFSIDKPVFIYTGLDKIPFEDSEIDFSKLGEIDFYLYEPSTYYNVKKKEKSCYFYHEDLWEENKNLRSIELDCLSELQLTNSIVVNVFTSDYNINKHFKHTYKNLNLACFDTFLRQVGQSGIFPDDTEKKKMFVCTNKRFAMHRLITTAYLQDKDGHYTWPFNMKCELESVAWYEHDKLTQVHDKYKLLKPHSIDIAEVLPITSLTHAGRAPEPNHAQPAELITAMSESCVAIVNETRFGQPTAYFSEKTFDAMRCMLPFILVAPPYTLEYLRKLGFSTFGVLWNEGYDKIENHTKRMDAILKLIDEVSNYSISDLNEMNRLCEFIYHKNRNQINEFMANQKIFY